ncbi:hypothetical protein EGR_07650 [Echinococcus granulosus]|uniref:Uncharacterized protein n=1 Tax=Echinococcus granulosus TaxID=6210 RepID=W6U911_ECHGR|nr:hypothetical protein EGR_07650 [Echinococcus granulosus]EUB57485.1 hypothetical protein EGR_07650 [Echinococcus granulosus]
MWGSDGAVAAEVKGVASYTFKGRVMVADNISSIMWKLFGGHVIWRIRSSVTHSSRRVILGKTLQAVSLCAPLGQPPTLITAMLSMLKKRSASQPCQSSLTSLTDSTGSELPAFMGAGFGRRM